MVILFGILLLSVLIALSWIDIREFRLPDYLTLPLAGIGLIQAYLAGYFVPSIIGMVAGYLVFVAIELVFKCVRQKDGLGRGDAKLLAAGGAWVGWMYLPFIVLIGSGLGLIAALFPFIRNRNSSDHIPFGPFLALAIFIVWTARRYVAG